MSDDDLADGHDNHEPLLSQSKREETKQPEPVAPKVSKVKSSKPVSEVKPEVKASKPEVGAAKQEVRESYKPPVKEKLIEKKEAPIEIKSLPIKDHESSDEGRSKAKKKSEKRRDRN